MKHSICKDSIQKNESKIRFLNNQNLQKKGIISKNQIFRLPFILPLLLVAQYVTPQTFEQIINLDGTPDPVLECIIELPNEEGFIVASDNSGGEYQIVMLDNTGQPEWTTFITSYTSELQLPSERLAYDPEAEVVIFVGQKSGSTNPAYTLLDVSDGSISGSEELSDFTGVITAVHYADGMGFFIGGHILNEDDDILNGFVGRIDVGDPSNDWFQTMKLSNDENELQIIDITVDVPENNLMAVGRRFHSDPGEPTSFFDIWLSNIDADDGGLGNGTFDYDPPVLIKTERLERVISLGNGTYLLSLSDKLNFAEGIMMIHEDGTKQWGNEYVGYSSEPEFNVLEICYHNHGMIGMLFSMTDEEGGTVFGLSGFDINGTEQWTRSYSVESVSDLIALKNGQFAMLGYDDNKNLLIFADQNGKTGCEENFELNYFTELSDLESISQFSAHQQNFSSFTATTIGSEDPDVTDGGCCWIGYEEFQGHVWYCGTATLEDHNASSTSYTYQWFQEDGVTGVTGATGPTLVIDPAAQSLGYPYTGKRVVKIEDGQGCKGDDWAGFTIIETNSTFPASGVVDQYCPGVSPQHAPPLTHGPHNSTTYGYTWPGGKIGEYQEPGVPGNITEDISTWSFVTSGHNTALQVFEDPATGCEVKREYEFEIMGSCNCTTTFTAGSWEDEYGDKIYGITNPQNDWKVHKYNITVSNPIDAPDDRYLITSYYGYPWFSEYWLKGFYSLASNDFELCLEAWFNSGFGTDVCGYHKSCISNIEVYPRKGKPEENKNETGIDLSDARPSVYPNPSNGTYNLVNPQAGSHYSVFDLNGKQVHTGVVLPESQNSFSITDMPSGPYVLHLFAENGEILFTKLLVKY